MKYIKVLAGELPIEKEEITKQDLIDVRNGNDCLIDLQNLTYFDGNDNIWKPIKPLK